MRKEKEIETVNFLMKKKTIEYNGQYDEEA